MDRDTIKGWAVVLAIVAVVLNVAFIFLSKGYYLDQAGRVGGAAATPEHITSVRIAFGVFVLVTCTGLALVPAAPRPVAYILTTAIAIGALVGGGSALAKGINALLPVTLFVTGGIVGTLGYFAGVRKSRAAWAFLVAIAAVLATCTLFGATKIRNALDIGLYYALIVPGLCAVTATALVAIRHDFSDK